MNMHPESSISNFRGAYHILRQSSKFKNPGLPSEKCKYMNTGFNFRIVFYTFATCLSAYFNEVYEHD